MLRAGLRRRRAWVQIAAAMLPGYSLRQTVHTHRLLSLSVLLIVLPGGQTDPSQSKLLKSSVVLRQTQMKVELHWFLH